MSDQQWQDSEGDQQTQPTGPSDVMRGFLMGTLLQVVGFILTILLALPAVMFIGVFQIVWMLPAFLVAQAKNRSSDFQKGLGLTAVIVFLLNAACFGILAMGTALNG